MYVEVEVTYKKGVEARDTTTGSQSLIRFPPFRLCCKYPNNPPALTDSLFVLLGKATWLVRLRTSMSLRYKALQEHFQAHWSLLYAWVYKREAGKTPNIYGSGEIKYSENHCQWGGESSGSKAYAEWKCVQGTSSENQNDLEPRRGWNVNECPSYLCILGDWLEIGFGGLVCRSRTYVTVEGWR